VSVCRMASDGADRRRYDSESTDDGGLPLPPGMDASWLAREGVNLLLNGGVAHADQLFKKYRLASPLMSSGASLVNFITAAMTYEEEKMEAAAASLRETARMCEVDNLFEGMLVKRPSTKWSTAERLERMIIWADCELFLSFLMFLKQRVVDFVKAGYHMRRAWKMYEKCHTEIHGSQQAKLNGLTPLSPMKTRKKKINPDIDLSEEEMVVLNSALSFGYGLVQMGMSIVPTGLLKLCELFGFKANREIGVNALEFCSSSEDMKAPIATLSLLWYHTVVRPFCGLDGADTEKGLDEADRILREAHNDFPKSAIFLYFRALVLRLRGKIGEAITILDETMQSSEDQREIALLCCYDKGWCHMLQLEWGTAVVSFQQLKSNSRWSEAYYTYLLAVNMGAVGDDLEAAHELMASVSKLVVRKTQLENYLTRKSLMYKKNGPSQGEYALLGIELLYLWNALPQCSHAHLRQMLKILNDCKTEDLQLVKLLVMGSIHSQLDELEAAEELLRAASVRTEKKTAELHVVPFALYELAMIAISKKKNLNLGRTLLSKSKDNHTGYDFENRLQFRIYAAMNMIEDMQSTTITSPIANMKGVVNGDNKRVQNGRHLPTNAERTLGSATDNGG